VTREEFEAVVREVLGLHAASGDYFPPTVERVSTIMAAADAYAAAWQAAAS
jgi:hypothetical protein